MRPDTIFVTCSLIYLIECNYDLNSDTNSSMLNVTQSTIIARKYCMNSWSVTQCLTLAIGMVFLFLRMHFILKAFCGVMILLFYAWLITIGSVNF
ncbi:hypothetical protein pipiens_001240 [Culex pipiens pipiens]|uniref:Uncharacterized protein n=1 Tax=Culex pipiens pipiens TaxID=38569 RepID=A0ABD1D9F2_CULPP